MRLRRILLYAIAVVKAMGNERAIILSGTIIASFAVIFGAISIFPGTTDVAIDPTAMVMTGHWQIPIANPDGSIVNYIQTDNFPTDHIKTEAMNAIFVGTATADPMEFIALGTNNVFTAVTAVGASSLADEVTAPTGRCDTNFGGAADINLEVAATAGGPATATRACIITIQATDDNENLVEIALFDSGTSGAGNMGSVSDVTGSAVILQTGMQVTSQVIFNIS